MNELQCTESVANEHPEGRHPEICSCILYNLSCKKVALPVEFELFFLPFISVMCISRKYPYPPSNGNRNYEGMGGGGGPKRGKRQFQREWGVVTEVFFQVV